MGQRIGGLRLPNDLWSLETYRVKSATWTGNTKCSGYGGLMVRRVYLPLMDLSLLTFMPVAWKRQPLVAVSRAMRSTVCITLPVKSVHIWSRMFSDRVKVCETFRYPGNVLQCMAM